MLASADKAPVKLAMVLLTSAAEALHNPMFWNKECLSGFPLKFPLQQHGHKSQTFTNTTVVAFFRVGPSYGPTWSMTSPSRRLCSSAAAAFRLRWQRWTRSTCQGHRCCHSAWNYKREVAPLCLDLIPLWIRLKKPEDSISTLWYFDIVDILWVFPCLKHHLHCASCHICSKLCLAYSNGTSE